MRNLRRACFLDVTLNSALISRQWGVKGLLVGVARQDTVSASIDTGMEHDLFAPYRTAPARRRYQQIVYLHDDEFTLLKQVAAAAGCNRSAFLVALVTDYARRHGVVPEAAPEAAPSAPEAQQEARQRLEAYLGEMEARKRELEAEQPQEARQQLEAYLGEMAAKKRELEAVQ